MNPYLIYATASKMKKHFGQNTSIRFFRIVYYGKISTKRVKHAAGKKTSLYVLEKGEKKIVCNSNDRKSKTRFVYLRDLAHSC